MTSLTITKPRSSCQASLAPRRSLKGGAGRQREKSAWVRGYFRPVVNDAISMEKVHPGRGVTRNCRQGRRSRGGRGGFNPPNNNIGGQCPPILLHPWAQFLVGYCEMKQSKSSRIYASGMNIVFEETKGHFFFNHILA